MRASRTPLFRNPFKTWKNAESGIWPKCRVETLPNRFGRLLMTNKPWEIHGRSSDRDKQGQHHVALTSTIWEVKAQTRTWTCECATTLRGAVVSVFSYLLLWPRASRVAFPASAAHELERWRFRIRVLALEGSARPSLPAH